MEPSFPLKLNDIIIGYQYHKVRMSWRYPDAARISILSLIGPSTCSNTHQISSFRKRKLWLIPFELMAPTALTLNENKAARIVFYHSN